MSDKEKIIEKNPSLKNKKISLPVLVPGLTAGISYIADLFLDETKTLLAADPSWDNYALIAQARRNAGFVQFELFKDGHFNIESFEKAVKKEAASGSVRVLLDVSQSIVSAVASVGFQSESAERQPVLWHLSFSSPSPASCAHTGFWTSYV